MRKAFKNLLAIISVVFLFCGMLFFVSSHLHREAWAASVSWVGTGDGVSWSDGGNWSTGIVPTAVDDVLIDANVTVDLGLATTINSLVLGNSGGTTSPVLNFAYDASGTSSPLVVDDGSVTIYSGGKITHSAGTDVVVGTVGLDIQTGDLLVSSGGSIDADGKGYSGGYGNVDGNGPGGGGGVYIDSSGSRAGGAGGAYAGDGGDANGSSGGIGYGQIETGLTIGSGGGGGTGVALACSVSAQGGSGGGLIELNVGGTLTIEGVLSSDGGSGTGIWSTSGQDCGAYGGGGGGGSINIVSNGLAGSGLITANGGDGNDVSYAAGGGGGRIYVDASTDTFSGMYSTYGGNGRGTEGGAGTVFKDTGTYGELIIDNGDRLGMYTTFTSTYSPYQYDTLTISNGSYAVLDTGATLTLNTYTIGSKFEPYGVVNSSSNLVIENEGELILPTTDALAFLDIFPYVTDLTINSGGVVTHKANTDTLLYYLDFDLNNISVNSGGSISVDNKGYSGGYGNVGGNGPGGGDGVYIDSSGSRAGAAGGAYAGNGGDANGGVGGTGYGDVATGLTIGSGGGGGTGVALACGYNARGGGGGGLIDLNVSGTLTIDGEISADGGSGTGGFSTSGQDCGAYGGGGGGGGVKIVSNSVTGTGTVTANGGDGNDVSYAGGGGGGRIYIDIATDNFTGGYSAYGGNGRGTEGGAGTIFWETGVNGELLIDNADRTGVETGLWSAYTPYEYDTITISNGSHLLVDTGAILTLNTYSVGGTFEVEGEVYGLTELIIGNEGTLLLPTTDTLNFSDTFPTVTDLTVNSGGVVTQKPNTDTFVYYIDLDLENLTINSGASVNADSKGYSGGYGNVDGNGPGGGGGVYIDSSGARAGAAGAAYAGDGGDANGAAGGTAYGDLGTGLDIGSGGGGGRGVTLACGYSARGGSGGGLINLNISGTLTIEGEISADGGSGTGGYTTAGWDCGAYGGGGGGGRVEVFASNFVGSGDISAVGGSGNNPTYAGGGGGGVIYVIYDSSTYTGTDSVIGGLGVNPGLDGVSFLTPSNTTPEALSSNIVFDSGAFFAGKTVDIVTKYSDADGKSDLDQLHITLDVESASEDIEYYATESTTNATDLTPTLVEGDTYIQDITYDIYAVSEGEYTVNENEIIVVWHVTPNWTWIDDSNIEIGVHATDDFPTTSTTSFTTSDYQYENDLTFTGTLTVTNSSDTTLVSEDWVSADESITWTGLTVVYEGYTNVYPLDSDFNVKVEDDEGNFWIDGTSSSTAFEVVTTSQSTTTNSDIHTVSIVDIPTGGTDISSQTFTIKVDGDNPSITNLNSTSHTEESTWYSDRTVDLSWVTEDLASGVESVYRYISNSTDEVNSTIESSGVLTSLTEWTSEELVDGVWYFYLLVKDLVDNEVNQMLQINIDSSIPDIVDITGEYEGVWQNRDNTPTISWTDPGSLSEDIFYITIDGSTPSSSNFEYALSSNSYTFSELEDGEYNIKVRAQNGAGTYSESKTFIYRYDSEPAGVVSNITTAVSSTNRITLNWSNPTDSDFDRVVVVRKASTLPTTLTDGTKIYEGSSTTYTDMGLNSSTKYYYAFWTYDHINNRSDRVSSTITTRDINAPDPVSEFEVEVEDNSEIKIKWKNPESSDFTKVILYRDDTLIYEGDLEEYIDTLDLEGEYEYVIYAYDSTGNESSSKSVTIQLEFEEEEEGNEGQEVTIIKEDKSSKRFSKGEKPEVKMGENVEIQIPVIDVLGEADPDESDVVILRVEDKEYKMILSEGGDYFSAKFKAPELEGGYTVYIRALRNGELLSQIDIELEVVAEDSSDESNTASNPRWLVGGLSLFLLLLIIVLIRLIISKRKQKV